MLLHDFKPHSCLVTQATRVASPRFPVIDAHNHLGESFGAWDHRPVSELLEVLDQAHVRVYIDLDGGRDEETFAAHLDHFKAAAPERFRLFGGVDWTAWPKHGDRFGEWAAGRLRAQFALGADGLKIFKAFGLHVLDQNGARVAVDDARLDALWETAGELHLPVLIHVADPVAFFAPLDANNERREELEAHPDWHFPSPPFPAFDAITGGLARLVARHPLTTFIGAHVGAYAENLAWVAHLLDQCPNFNVDMSARVAELGRQPRAARQFFCKYADRILFGTDVGPDLGTYRIYYRFLETDDEYFDYDVTEIPRQGRWRIYGLGLPENVLEQVYFRNAERLILKRRA